MIGQKKLDNMDLKLKKSIINSIESRISNCEYQILSFIQDNNNFEIMVLLNNNGYITKKIFIIEVIRKNKNKLKKNDSNLTSTLNSNYDPQSRVPTITEIIPPVAKIGEKILFIINGEHIPNIRKIFLLNKKDNSDILEGTIVPIDYTPIANVHFPEYNEAGKFILKAYYGDDNKEIEFPGIELTIE